MSNLQYLKRFGREAPEYVTSIEERGHVVEAKKAAKRAARLERRAAAEAELLSDIGDFVD